jgi:uncharacterized protein
VTGAGAIRRGLARLAALRLAALRLAALRLAALGLAAVWLTVATASGAWADGSAGTGDVRAHLWDRAGLLTGVQEATLEQELERLSAEHGADFVIVTVPSLGMRTATEFADDYFSFGPDPENPDQPGRNPDAGWGQGGDKSGILFLVAPEGRHWALATHGDAIDVYTDAVQDRIMGQVLPYLGRDDWYGGFQEFLSGAGQAYSDAGRFRWEIVALAAVAGGLIGGFVPVTLWRRQLKTVRPAPDASDYLDPASLRLTAQTEVLVSQNTSVHYNQQHGRSGWGGGGGGGSSIHFGSSGSRFGGSSGRF